MQSKYLKTTPVNAGSMADIAFLLLIFFLVSTTILQEKGLTMQLPPKMEDGMAVPVAERNLFKILINSQNQFLIDGEIQASLSGLRQDISNFVMNEGRDPSSSIRPQKAIVSIKANRGSHYGQFIAVLDEVKAAYYGIYAVRAGLSVEEYVQLDATDPVQAEILDKARRGIPMNISIAEPDI